VRAWIESINSNVIIHLPEKGIVDIQQSLVTTQNARRYYPNYSTFSIYSGALLMLF
tara:strand:- start:677 stop:844 length:168 start_codon:yes stop_codon:yes gene_type:complete